MTDHILYEDGDENIPKVIIDRNGQVALDMCKCCGAAEIELTLYLTCEEFVNKDNEDETES